jgi:hypothetical protein
MGSNSDKMDFQDPSSISQEVTWYQTPLFNPASNMVPFGDYSFYRDGVVVLGGRYFKHDDLIVNYVFNGHRANRPKGDILTINAPSGETYHFAYKTIWIPFVIYGTYWFQLIPRYVPKRPPFWKRLLDGLADIWEYGKAILSRLSC